MLKKLYMPLDRPYKAYIGKKAWEEIPALIKSLGWDKVCIVSDRQVASLYLSPLQEVLAQGDWEVHHHIIEGGEASKDLAHYLGLVQDLLEKGFSRQDGVLALGGGVVGDLTGFAAASFMRGIDFIQVPTSLLGAVDASLGGKTGINLDQGKNLLGAFHQPRGVFIQPQVFQTLAPESYQEAFGEIIKYAMIADEDLFSQLEAGTWTMEDLVFRCLSIKKDRVLEDEKDQGIRKTLNFGHSFGHGIEKASGYQVSHGQAVAMGMVLVARAALEEGFPEEDFHRMRALLDHFGLNRPCPFGEEEIFRALLADKKRRPGGLDLVVPKKIGQVEIRPMDLEEVRVWLKRGLS
ncbi:MAG: 3-dehydroquinate synthase [Tissierellia bacterium]|nr:3-dehydroquinate synthase [Tissierellia bacterium]